MDPRAAPEGDGETDEPEGWSTGTKVAVGAGVVAGTGLLAYGAFKLGEYVGWWGGSNNQIVIDGPTDGGGGGGGGDEATPGGGGSIAVGKPPNMSGDPGGYNTKLFPSPMAVRIAMKSLGYGVEIEADPLVGFSETHGEVEHFQRDWNAVIHGIDRGKVKLPKTAANLDKLRMYRGLLTVDDVPGKYTLRAVEIAVRNLLINKVKFSELRKAAG